MNSPTPKWAIGFDPQPNSTKKGSLHFEGLKPNIETNDTRGGFFPGIGRIWRVHVGGKADPVDCQREFMGIHVDRAIFSWRSFSGFSASSRHNIQSTSEQDLLSGRSPKWHSCIPVMGSDMRPLSWYDCCGQKLPPNSMRLMQCKQCKHKRCPIDQSNTQ